jgi:hypothetical protein
MDTDSDDEGEVPPLLGPDSAAMPNLPSKKASNPSPAITAAAASTAPSSGSSVASAPTREAVTAPKPGANLKPSSGLKKGFLSGGSSSRSANKAASAAKPSSSSSSLASSCGSSSSGGAMPTLRADQAAKAKSLQLPEVQGAIEAEQAEAAKLGGGKNGSPSWMTPDLLQKIASSPVLRKAFTDPRCQTAMSEMQTNPQEAMRKYGDNPEMRTFLQTFMKLMGEHFTKLAEKEEAEQAPKMTPEQRKAQEVAQTAMADPEVRTIVQEPKVQALLQQMQSGQPFELEAAVKSDPEMVRKLRKLSEAGLINMQWMR